MLLLLCSGSQVTVRVQLEREDDDILPEVVAPFFPLVSSGIQYFSFCKVTLIVSLHCRNVRKDGGLSSGIQAVTRKC